MIVDSAVAEADDAGGSGVRGADENKHRHNGAQDSEDSHAHKAPLREDVIITFLLSNGSRREETLPGRDGPGIAR
ncbi:hypothetical protein [Streptomyces syringium]|uniref:hypothetical protein n=1 Tax=Streptomyces syringium TaxID=76729 RepID=UPI0033F65E01